jgi:cardiolipin synthase
MPSASPRHTVRAETSLTRVLAEQAFSRATGASLIAGNRVRLLRDADENYPAWLDAIGQATKTIHFESYVIYEDQTGQRFADALIAKAQQGLSIRVLYDWLGSLPNTSRRFWRRLREAGVDVRGFNSPHISSPFGWIGRDHRKVITVDGQVGFASGLCVGDLWTADRTRGREPWRDTGIEVRGPAVADIEAAFASVWALAGSPLPPGTVPKRESIAPAGDVSVRVVASEPSTAGVYRLDQLIAAGARRTLWLTDAYFIGTTAYAQALVAAARDGVDVRLLVPGSSDNPVVGALSRAGYRVLLEGGVRVFEWNGSMLHAKTAVADGHWARVGSTNLNLASWLSNWELDVAVEDEPFAREMEALYLEDLEHSTEIVLTARNRVRASRHPEPPRPRRRMKRRTGSAGRAMAGAIGIGSAVGAAITNHRVLGPAEARLMASGGLLLGVVAVLAWLYPRAIALPVAVISAWIAISLLVRAYALHAEPRRDTARDAESLPAPPSTRE